MCMNHRPLISLHSHSSASPLSHQHYAALQPCLPLPLQGPLRHTRDAFWQMVSEQHCSTIIMLTRTGGPAAQGCHGCIGACERLRAGSEAVCRCQTFGLMASLCWVLCRAGSEGGNCSWHGCPAMYVLWLAHPAATFTYPPARPLPPPPACSGARRAQMLPVLCRGATHFSVSTQTVEQVGGCCWVGGCGDYLCSRRQ